MADHEEEEKDYQRLNYGPLNAKIEGGVTINVDPGATLIIRIMDGAPEEDRPEPE